MNIIYETCVISETLLETIKERYFHYIQFDKKQFKTFKHLFGKHNRDFEDSLEKKHK